MMKVRTNCQQLKVSPQGNKKQQLPFLQIRSLKFQKRLVYIVNYLTLRMCHHNKRLFCSFPSSDSATNKFVQTIRNFVSLSISCYISYWILLMLLIMFFPQKLFQIFLIPLIQTFLGRLRNHKQRMRMYTIQRRTSLLQMLIGIICSSFMNYFFDSFIVSKLRIKIIRKQLKNLSTLILL